MRQPRTAAQKNAYRQTPEGREKWLAAQKRYRESDKAKAVRAAYRAERFANDLSFKLKEVLRRRIKNNVRRYLSGGSKGGSVIQDLGCPIEDFMKHLEGLWKPGMSWDNYPEEWQIDHIKALGLFDLTDPEQFKQAVHFTNQQPLSTSEHLAKTRLDRELIRQKAA